MTDTPKKQPRLYVNLFGAPLLLGAMYYGDVFFILLFAGVCFFSIYEFNELISFDPSQYMHLIERAFPLCLILFQ